MASPACSLVAIASASFLLVAFVAFVASVTSVVAFVASVSSFELVAFELVEEPSCQVVTSHSFGVGVVTFQTRTS
jgi:hypothetical protein